MKRIQAGVFRLIAGLVLMMTIALLGFVLFSRSAVAYNCDLIPDAEAYVKDDKPDESHPVSHGGKLHIMAKDKTKRSFLYFSSIPGPVESVKLWIYSSAKAHDYGTVGVYETTWLGEEITWNTQPAPGALVDSKYVSGSGWVSFDVTSAVSDGGPLSLELKMVDETNRTQHIDFNSPCLEITLLNVEVTGLTDLEVTQDMISQGLQYVSLGTLSVTVHATVNYQLKIYYEVSPSPSPAFTGDPLSFEYPTNTWTTIPAWPAMVPLPGFPGTPTGLAGETHTYPVRVDLAALGDRAAGEVFTFTVHVLISESSGP